VHVQERSHASIEESIPHATPAVFLFAIHLFFLGIIPYSLLIGNLYLSASRNAVIVRLDEDAVLY
jgi:hypothetical protein